MQLDFEAKIHQIRFIGWGRKGAEGEERGGEGREGRKGMGWEGRGGKDGQGRGEWAV